MSRGCKLTIAVITMNRAEQLIEALESCIACKLPVGTEIVILDNGSTDGTRDTVKTFSEEHLDISVKYEYSSVNLGVGGGRSCAFELAQGEYVYFLDDDAVIAEESRNRFFVDSVDYLDRNRNVASLTTRIYDEMLVCDREVSASQKNAIDGLPKIFMYLGGSHFLRKEYFDLPLYFDIKYGNEENAPCIKAQNKGYSHVFDDHVFIIHKPRVNKWVKGTSNEEYVFICCIAVCYATKKILYPTVFLPILWAGYLRRCKKHLSIYPGAKKRADKMVKEILKNNKSDKVSVSCVLRMVREFGLTVL